MKESNEATAAHGIYDAESVLTFEITFLWKSFELQKILNEELDKEEETSLMDEHLSLPIEKRFVTAH